MIENQKKLFSLTLSKAANYKTKVGRAELVINLMVKLGLD